MKITEFLAAGDVLVDVRAADKARLLEELCRHAASALNIDADPISAAILKREELGSTGMGGGVAIPHARVVGVTKPYGVLARLKNAIAFDSVDGQPVDLVFLLLLPTASVGDQLNALALVARTLRDADTLRNARRTADPASLYAVVAPTQK